MKSITETKTVPILAWELNGQCYGLYLENCKEVTEGLTFERVLGAPPEAPGVVNIRGEVLTVVNLALLLDNKAAVQINEKTPLIRLKNNNIALMADKILDILDVQPVDIDAGSVRDDKNAAYFEGIAQTKFGLITVLNTTRLEN